ncbi:MAG: YgaP family membrane protein [Candidatus Dormibacteria bacterium]
MTRPDADMAGAISPAKPPRGALRAQSDKAWLRRPSVNITTAERAGRILIGLAAVIVGAVLLSAATSVVTGVLEALLIAAGLDMFVTGALGHCPLYQKLGYTPRSLKEQI